MVAINASFSSSFQMPLLSLSDGNYTMSTTKMVTEIGLDGFLMVPMISFITNIAIAQAFARKYKYEIDATQELIALGFTNFISSFFSAFPITGSFSRSSVNAASGVCTQLGGQLCKENTKNIQIFLFPVKYN